MLVIPLRGLDVMVLFEGMVDVNDVQGSGDLDFASALRRLDCT